MTHLMDGLFVMAAEAGGAAAPAAGRQAGAPGSLTQGIWSLMPFILIIVVFFWLMNRSQRKRERERQQMLDSIRPRDEVVTVGGIHGRVVQIKDDLVVLRIDPEKDVKITIARTGISRRLADQGQQ